MSTRTPYHMETFPPEEIFIYEQEEASKMYLLKKGVVTAKGRIFTAGAVLGEDMLVGSRRPNGFNARTLTYSVGRCGASLTLELESDMLSTLDT